MKWWPLYGLFRKLTERATYQTPLTLNVFQRGMFRRSLFVYVIDVGSSNSLNFEISAMESPVYNIHRFGIYLTDSPRHADLLLVLGRPTAPMVECLEVTISHIPRPFGIVTIDDSTDDLPLFPYPELPNHVAALEGVPSAAEILGLLINLSGTKTKQS